MQDCQSTVLNLARSQIGLRPGLRLAVVAAAGRAVASVTGDPFWGDVPAVIRLVIRIAKSERVCDLFFWALLSVLAGAVRGASRFPGAIKPGVSLARVPLAAIPPGAQGAWLGA